MDPQPFDYLELIPEHWFTNSDTQGVYVSAYDIVNIAKPNIPDALHFHINLIDSIVILFKGKLNYQKTVYDVQYISNVPSLKTVQSSNEETDISTHLLIITRLRKSGNTTHQLEIDNSINTAIGLLYTFFGRSIAFNHIYDNEIDLVTKRASASGKSFLDTRTFNGIRIDYKIISTIEEAYKKIDESKDSDRFQLSLRWFADSYTTDDQTDAFLKNWIALETLAINSGSNIKPINSILANCYSMPEKEVVKYFMVGRLLKLRNNIVHNGAKIAPNSIIMDYARGLFVDIFFTIMGIPNSKQAKSILCNPYIDLSTEISNLNEL